jgi:alpha,alpha-trehalose phosphorylase
LDVLEQSESVFTLANDDIGWRANLEEGEPQGLQGICLNGVFEFRPLSYVEAGSGYPGVDPWMRQEEAPRESAGTTTTGK